MSGMSWMVNAGCAIDAEEAVSKILASIRVCSGLFDEYPLTSQSSRYRLMLTASTNGSKHFSNTSTDFSYVQTENLADFENTAFSKSFGIKPILTYSFSKYVDGDLYLNYVLTENHTTGKKKETNIGFKIRIYFESFE